MHRRETKPARENRPIYFEIAETEEDKTLKDVFVKWRHNTMGGAVKEMYKQMHKEIRHAMAKKYTIPLGDLPSETLDEMFEKWQREIMYGTTKEMYEQVGKEIRHETARQYNIPLKDLPNPIPLSFIRKITKNKKTNT